ncbi:MAG: GNAT family N-acetyltransferase [Anaerolineae bacterium]|nr:GNAT family N-acetyltransferase [Anaerolineae bacterium]
MQTQIKPAAALTAKEVDLVAALNQQVFGQANADYVWATADWHVLLWVGNEDDASEVDNLVGHIEIVVRTCTVDDYPVRVGGIGKVATAPNWRGRGLASAALQRAQVFIAEVLGLEFCLLVCSEAQAPFFKALSWNATTGPLWFSQPGGRVQLKGVTTMVRSCSGRPFPSGSIDLCGLPW